MDEKINFNIKLTEDQGADAVNEAANKGTTPVIAPERSTYSDWPLEKLIRNLPRTHDGEIAVLLSTGALNPAHLGHRSMMEQARRAIEKQGIQVRAIRSVVTVLMC